MVNISEYCGYLQWYIAITIKSLVHNLVYSRILRVYSQIQGVCSLYSQTYVSSILTTGNEINAIAKWVKQPGGPTSGGLSGKQKVIVVNISEYC